MKWYQELGNEALPPCFICKKVWKRKNSDKFVYHDSKGIVCRHHPGVMEWYNDLIEKANKEE